METKIYNVAILLWLHKIAQSTDAYLIKFANNKAIWINKKMVTKTLRPLTENEKRNKVKLDLNNPKKFSRHYFNIGLPYQYLYDVVETTKSVRSIYEKTGEKLSAAILASLLIKYRIKLLEKWKKNNAKNIQYGTENNISWEELQDKLNKL